MVRVDSRISASERGIKAASRPLFQTRSLNVASSRCCRRQSRRRLTSNRGAKNQGPANLPAPFLFRRESWPQLFGRLRIINVSYEYSATCHHRFSSLRKVSIEVSTFL